VILADPIPGDIVNASATATTTGLVTVPGGRNLTATVQLSASVTATGATCTPFLVFTVPGGTSGAAPANGAVLARLTAATAIASTSGVSVSDTTEIYVYGGDNGCTLDFTAGASGTSSVVVSGFLI
jgi:hypothetical protein